MTKELKKMIVVDYCDTCPYHGTCKPWKALTRQQRVKLTIGVGVGRFILKDCPLPDMPNSDVIDILAPVKELEGAFPVVLYFRNDEDREEFVSIFNEAVPHAVCKKL
ncbi:MAG: hypothetical protein V3V40_06505 [Nitrosomonadaceae bacterium]